MKQTEISNLIMRANALLKSNWLHAVNLLEQANDQYPDNLRIIMNLGDIYMEKQFFEKALSYYQKASALRPDSPQLHFLIGTCYFSMYEYRIAISYFNRISDPTPEVLYNKALCHAFNGSYKESIETIQQFLKVMDNNPFIYFLLIEQYIRIQNYETANEVIRTAEARFGKHRQLMLLSALVNSKRGIWLKAYHCFAEYEVLGAINSPEHLIYYANSAAKIGLPDKAMDLLRRAQNLNPYLSTIYEELIRLQLHRGDLAGARESLKQAKKNIIRFGPILRLLQERVNNEDTEY
jgi:tetratricopeptide (TPR) repeat protein